MSDAEVTAGRQQLEAAMVRLIKGIRDPEAGRKARQDMDRMREETRQRIGIVNVAVELVREAHDE